MTKPIRINWGLGGAFLLGVIIGAYSGAVSIVSATVVVVVFLLIELIQRDETT